MILDINGREKAKRFWIVVASMETVEWEILMLEAQRRDFS